MYIKTNKLRGGYICDVRVRNSRFTNVTTLTDTVNRMTNLRFTNVTVNGDPVH